MVPSKLDGTLVVGLNNCMINFEMLVDLFNENTTQSKYRKWYITICERGSKRGYSRKQIKSEIGYVEGHHFIPVCINKTYEKEKSNIVFLTAREHFICHFLLCKIYQDTTKYYSLLSAFGKMSCVPPHMIGYRYLNSKLFSHFRNNVSSLMGSMKDNKVRMRKDGITKEVERNEVEEHLSNGWIKGAAQTKEAKESRVKANKQRSGFIWMHFPGEKSFQIRKEQLEEMIAKGAVRGRTFSKTAIENLRNPLTKNTGKTRITDGVVVRSVTKRSLDKLLDKGWKLAD